MKTSVVEYAEVYAVVDQRVGSSCDGIIDAIYVDTHLANDILARKQQMATRSDEQQWGVLAYLVTSLLRVPTELTMLIVVYEGDDVGIRPVQLYAQESLAQGKVRELDVEEQIRLITDELSGQSSSKKRYWWEVCPLLQ